MRANPLAAINSVALAIGTFSSMDEMLDYALARVLDVVEIDAASVYLLNEERQDLVMVAQQGLSDAAWQNFDRLRLGEGLSGRVALTGEPIVVQKLKDDPRLTRMAARLEGFCAFASIPLRSNFRTYGTLNMYSRAARQFSEQEIQLLTSMGSQIGLAVANARLYLELQASERKFRGLVENAEALIYLTDRNGRLTYANPALRNLLGYDPASLCRERWSMLALVDPADHQRFACMLQRILGGNVERSVEFRMVPAEGGDTRWFSQTSVPLRDDSGIVTGIQCLAHDITDRLAMQRQIADADRLSALGRMAATIAHEIRNPLGAIVNSIGVLRCSEAVVNRSLLGIVSEEANRLDRILSEFLLFARPPKVAAVPCDASELVDTTVALFRQGSKMYEAVSIRVCCAPNLPPVLADPNQMRQVLWNLLDNAVDATSETGGTVEVSARLDPDSPNRVLISVADEGPGLAHPAAMFEPFFTTKPQGTGLGLAVVARIVRDHSGSINAATIEPRGARLTIALPTVIWPWLKHGDSGGKE